MRIIVRLFFILILSITSIAQGQEIQTVSGKVVQVSDLDASLDELIRTLEVPGLSIAILNDGAVAYHNVFGVANLQTGERITKTSIFEGASLSKPIFAYFAMKMVEKGVIDLDTPLFEYLPHPAIAEDSQEEYKLITARMVLSHSAGFPNHSNGQIIELAFKPGTGFAYSGEAYQYLAATIGILNGVGWKSGLNEIFKSEVTTPLGMQHSSFLWTEYLAANKVYGHDEAGKATHNDRGGWSGETFNAFSSLHSEAAEYARFIEAMINQEGLSEASFREMLKEQNAFSASNEILKETGQTGWGLGFAQKPTPNGLMHLHTGNNHDFQSYAMFIPEKRYGLVLFTNSGKMLDLLSALEDVLEPQF